MAIVNFLKALCAQVSIFHTRHDDQRYGLLFNLMLKKICSIIYIKMTRASFIKYFVSSLKFGMREDYF